MKAINQCIDDIIEFPGEREMFDSEEKSKK